MSRRPLPTAAEAAEILARKRSRPPRRPSPHVARPLSPLLVQLEAKFGKGAGDLVAHWPEIIADPRLARFTEPIKVVKLRGQGGSILELKVDGPASALIQHQAEAILSRVNLVLGGQTVVRLRIVQGVVKPRPERATAAKRQKALAPLDAAAEAELEARLSEIKDPGLASSLRKLGRAVLRGR